MARFIASDGSVETCRSCFRIHLDCTSNAKAGVSMWFPIADMAISRFHSHANPTFIAVSSFDKIKPAFAPFTFYIFCIAVMDRCVLSLLIFWVDFSVCGSPVPSGEMFFYLYFSKSGIRVGRPISPSLRIAPNSKLHLLSSSGDCVEGMLGKKKRRKKAWP